MFDRNSKVMKYVTLSIKWISYAGMMMSICSLYYSLKSFSTHLTYVSWFWSDSHIWYFSGLIISGVGLIWVLIMERKLKYHIPFLLLISLVIALGINERMFFAVSHIGKLFIVISLVVVLQPIMYLYLK